MVCSVVMCFHRLRYVKRHTFEMSIIFSALETYLKYAI